MSNLSDLLPAGAGAKVATLTADGTLTSGLPVALQSDGTVKAISETSTSVSAAQGSENDFTTDAPNKQIQIVHDSTNDKMVIVHIDASNNGKATVATTDGSSALTYGSAATFESGGMDDAVAAAFDSTNGKVVIAWKDANNSNYGTAIVGTVSGTSISFGTPTVFQSSRAEHIGMTFDSYNGKIVVAFGDDGASPGRTPKAVVGTVSGTSISFGSSVTIESASGTEGIMGVGYDSTNYKVVIGYLLGNDQVRCVVGTVSGTSISFGSITTVETGQDTRGYNNNVSVVYDSTNERVMIVYLGEGTGGAGAVKAAVGTVSGTSITFGSVSTLTNNQSKQQDAAYNAAAGKVIVIYCDDSSNNDGFYHEVTIASSGNSFTAGSAVNFMAGNINDIAIGYDSTGKMSVIAFRDFSGGNKGEAFPLVTAFTDTTTNVSDFVGITNQAISDSASGEVAVQGGTITNSSLFPANDSMTFGSAANFEEASLSYINAAFDSTNNKVVVAYRDVGNSSYGTAVVGTISGTGITFGTPVVFNSGNSSHIGICFDDNSDKVVITYMDLGNNFYGTAIVGSVSGDSISFGTEVVYNNTGFTQGNFCAFDSNSNKVVIVYNDDDNGDQGTAIVGTVSGTSISFGSEAIFDTGTLWQTTNPVAAAFDSNSNKMVIAYSVRNGSSSARRAIVGTVSGTGITFGTAVAFDSDTSDFNAQPRIAFDSTANKVVIAYIDPSNLHGTAIVGTVSGTSISFGTKVAFNADETKNISIAYDSNANRTIISYEDDAGSDYGEVVEGTISGTDISFGSAASFNAADTSWTSTVFDSNANKVAILYKDQDSTYGKGVVATASTGAVPDLTIGSTYYVQDDGTLSTTSSSVTAGKALSATTLLLNG